MVDVKGLFPIFENNDEVVYLDSAASAQKPLSVINGMADVYMYSYANIHRGLYKLSETASSLYDDARKKVQKFIGARYSSEVIFTKGATEAVNLLANAFSYILKSGDEIIVSEVEHHSNFVPWQQLALKLGVTLKIMPVLGNGELDYDWLRENVSSAVKLLCVSGQSNVIGLENDIVKVVELAHQVGAKVVVDGAQLVCHKSVNVATLDVDFFFFSGHKIYGPTGIGVLYGKIDLLREFSPYQYGGDMVDRVGIEKSTFKDVPEKFEAGTPPIVEAVGLGYAIDFVSEIGIDVVENHCRELTLYTINEISKIEDVKIVSSLNANGLVSFVVDGVSSFDIASYLSMKNICVRVGKHCAEPLHIKLGVESSIRVSFGIYNTKEDVDKFMVALKKSISLIKG